MVVVDVVSKSNNEMDSALSVDCIIMHTAWTGYIMLHSKRSIHESGREYIGQGNAIGSLIVQSGLQS